MMHATSNKQNNKLVYYKHHDVVSSNFTWVKSFAQLKHLVYATNSR